MKLTRRQVILVKAEPSYGTPATLTPADAILVKVGSTIDVSGEEVKRDILRDTMTPAGHIVASKMVQLKFAVEARGGGLASAGTDILPPEFSELLLACGMKETGSGATSYVYAPMSDPAQMGSCTIGWYRDGIYHKAVGCMGTWTFTAAVNQIGTIEFDMTGLYVDPEDKAVPVTNLLALDPPVCVDMNLMLGVYKPVLSQVQVAIGNQVVPRKDLNSSSGLVGVMIKDRQPSGSVDPEAAALADYNPFDLWSKGTRAAITAQLGKDKGNTIKLSIPKAQYGSPKYGDRDGILVYQQPFTATGTADDELKLEFA